jgi:hypothetical protein
MSDNAGGAAGSGISQKTMEIAIAVATAIFGLIVIYGSMQAGIGWGIEGPRAGFFPFYIGAIIVGSSVVTFIQIVANGVHGPFADWEQLRRVVSVVIPSGVYVALVPWIRIYVASAILIAAFMKWFGRYGWGFVAAVAIGMPVATFLVFERWFLVPLPKGPIEEFLGF